MKTLTIIAIASVLVGSSAFSQEPKPLTDFTIELQYFLPDYEDYDFGFGVEGQYRCWKNQNLGFSLAGGVSSWEVDDLGASVYGGPAVGVSSRDGSVDLVPIGGSILYRPTLGDNISVILEGGLRYVIVDSDVKVGTTALSALGDVMVTSEKVDIDDGVVGLIAASLESELSPGLTLFGGIGYQFDISKGDAKMAGENLGKNELKSFFLRVGIAVGF